MRQIDNNLSPKDPHNIEAAQARGLKWSDEYRMYINRDGTIPSGDEGSNDTRWGHMSESDIAHAHK